MERKYDEECEKLRSDNDELRRMLEELIVAVTDCSKCVYDESGCNLWDGGKCNLEERNVKKAEEMGIFAGSNGPVGGPEKGE